MITLDGKAATGLAGAATYDLTAKALHWLVVVLVVLQFTTALLLPQIEVDTSPDAVINLHSSFGIVILLVMSLRLMYRWLNPVRMAARDSPAWERTIARASHFSFYLLLILGPFLGWASASAHSVPIRLFGILALPALAARKAQWGIIAGDIHGYAMWALLGLIGMHAVAALFHHFIRQDDVLRRMLPSTWRT